jgi:hypothetical protein
MGPTSANVSTDHVSRAEHLCNEAALAVVDGVPGARSALAVAELLLARARARFVAQ